MSNREQTAADWSKLRRFMVLGMLAGVLVLIGDMLLGWGVKDPSRPGLEGMLAAYVNLSDARIFWSALLGFIGIPLESLCYISIYRLIKPRSERYARLYKIGSMGYLGFGGCGVHVPCLACVFFYKYMTRYAPDVALSLSVRFGAYFLLPGMLALIAFWVVHSYAQISAFARGLTPYPKWCWVFSMPVGMGMTSLLHLFGNHAPINAITAGWISVGNIWMFGGLLLMSRRARR